MLIKIVDVCDFTLSGFNHDQDLYHKSKIFLHNPHHKNMVVFNSKDKQGFQPLRSRTRLHNYGNNRRRKVVVYSMDPGASPSGPPTNILSWVVGVAIAIVIPLIGYKWGPPSLKSKIDATLQTAEDVAEAVEKVAEKVEKVAEDIVDDLPKDGKLREVIDLVEKIAERAADDAGAIDDFIDKVQEQEEKAESLVKSLKDDFKQPPEDPKEDENSNVGN